MHLIQFHDHHNWNTVHYNQFKFAGMILHSENSVSRIFLSLAIFTVCMNKLALWSHCQVGVASRGVFFE